MALDQAFDAATLHLLRAAVRAHASAAGMPEERATDVMLAAHELAANAVRHGAGSGRLRMDITAGLLCCQVSEVGRAGPDGRAGRGAAAPPWPVVPGHGLWVAQNTADRMSMAAGADWSVVTAVFVLPSTASPSAPDEGGSRPQSPQEPSAQG